MPIRRPHVAIVCALVCGALAAGVVAPPSSALRGMLFGLACVTVAVLFGRTRHARG